MGFFSGLFVANNERTRGAYLVAGARAPTWQNVFSAPIVLHFSMAHTACALCIRNVCLCCFFLFFHQHTSFYTFMLCVPTSKRKCISYIRTREARLVRLIPIRRLSFSKQHIRNQVMNMFYRSKFACGILQNAVRIRGSVSRLLLCTYKCKGAKQPYRLLSNDRKR